MPGVCSLEVYEVKIEELYDGMFWPELDGCVPEKRVSNNTVVSSNFPSFEKLFLDRICCL